MSNITKTAHDTKFEDEFSEEVWRTTYKDHNDETINDTLYRVAKAAGSVEETEELKEEAKEKIKGTVKAFRAGSIESI